MAPGFIPVDRQERIHSLIRKQGIVKVTDLSKMLGVSELTIRRDLAVLEQRGILEKTHGGAIYSFRMRVEPLYTQKDRIHREEKDAIGKAAAQLVEEGDTLLINSGSTTRQVIHYLRDKKVRIITSNLSAVPEAMESEMELILIGGHYRSQSNSIIGPLAHISLKQAYGSKAFIGVDGVSLKYGLTTPILEEAEVARRMIEQTPGPIIVVADHSKLGVVSNFITAPIDKIHMLVTDDGIEEEYQSNLEKAGIKVVIASTNRFMKTEAKP
ncbi:MAG: DeoR/GlpR family DNA-binding transcription regulator [Thermodesulfovibrionales bacterium]